MNDVAPSPLEEVLKTATLNGEPVDIKFETVPDVSLTAGEKAMLQKIVAQGNVNTVQLGNLALQKAKMLELISELDEGHAKLVAETQALQKSLAERADEILSGKGIAKEDMKNWSFNVDNFCFMKLR